MSTRIRQEEYAALGDFIKKSFVRDQHAIMQRFPKLNKQFLTTFNEKLEAVKVLDSKNVLTQEQKTVGASLYNEADELNKELTFLNRYLTSAKLDTKLVTALKEDLTINNIEGAVLKIEAVKQYTQLHSAELIEEGMHKDFVSRLDTHKKSLAEKNAQQNDIMNSGKTMTETNLAAYTELYEMITKIANDGRLVFKDKVTEDEYSITKIIARMRAPKRGDGKKEDN